MNPTPKSTGPEELAPAATMAEVLAAFPGAQRALFRRYHIGGCSSCSFQPGETLAQVCQRNGGLDVQEVLEHLKSSYEEDAKLLIEPKELSDWLSRDKSIRLLDVRSREEYEAVHLPDSVLLSQPVMQAILAEADRPRPLVIIDHQGKQALDAAAYFLGQGLQKVRCLRGGLDAWSQEVDPTLPRYKLR